MPDYSVTISLSCSNSWALSRWCHPTISSFVAPFSSCPQSFPASRSFPISQLFGSLCSVAKVLFSLKYLRYVRRPCVNALPRSACAYPVIIFLLHCYFYFTFILLGQLWKFLEQNRYWSFTCNQSALATFFQNLSNNLDFTYIPYWHIIVLNFSRVCLFFHISFGFLWVLIFFFTCL